MLQSRFSKSICLSITLVVVASCGAAAGVGDSKFASVLAPCFGDSGKVVVFFYQLPPKRSGLRRRAEILQLPSGHVLWDSRREDFILPQSSWGVQVQPNGIALDGAVEGKTVRLLARVHDDLPSGVRRQVCAETLWVAAAAGGDRKRHFKIGGLTFDLVCNETYPQRAAILLYSLMDPECRRSCSNACYVQAVRSEAMMPDGATQVLPPDVEQFDQALGEIAAITDSVSGTRLDLDLDVDRGPCFPVSLAEALQSDSACIYPKVQTKDLDTEQVGFLVDSPWRTEAQLPENAIAFRVTYETCLLCKSGPAQANALGCRTWIWERLRGSRVSKITLGEGTAWPSEGFRRALQKYFEKQGSFRTFRIYNTSETGR